MKNFIRLFSFCMLVSFWPVLGQHQDATGFYVGFSLGNSDHSDLANCENCNESTRFNVFDDTIDVSKALHAGYRFHENFALEIGYYNLGISHFNVRNNDENGEFESLRWRNSDLRGWSSAAIGILPVSKRFDLFAKLGTHYYDLEQNLSKTTIGAGFSDLDKQESSDFGFFYGAGVNLNLSRSWTIGAFIENYAGKRDAFQSQLLDEEDPFNISESANFNILRYGIRAAFRF